MLQLGLELLQAFAGELNNGRFFLARLSGATFAPHPQAGTEILVPGERGQRNALKNTLDLSLPAPVLEELRALAASLGVEVPT